MSVRRLHSRLGALLCAALLGCVVGQAEARAQASPAPLQPQPTADQMEPGLTVSYYFDFYRQVSQLEAKVSQSKGKIGPPILSLDYNVGQGNVLTSDRGDGVGAKIEGLIRLEKPGIYTFMAQSNDGIRIKIGGQQIIEDPDVHSDRFSEPGGFMIDRTGWYPLSILYFERKSTSTLELYWRPPGDEGDTMALVPAAALAHLKAP